MQSRSGFVRLAVLAAASASCLVVAACGVISGGGAAGAGAGGTPSASSTVDPLKSLTGKQIAKKAIADAKAASGLTLAGTLRNSRGVYTISLGFKPGKGCAGRIGAGAKGSFKIIVIGTTAYLNPDTTFWTAHAGSAANAVIALVSGRYIKASTTNHNMASLVKLCNMSEMLSSLKMTGTITKGTVFTHDGIRVLKLKDSKGGVMYVTDTSTPQLLEIAKPKDNGDGTGKVTMSVGAPVTLTAPPANQVIDGAKLGF